MTADAFEKLRLPDELVVPRTEFAQSLRTRIERALGVVPSTATQGATMSSTSLTTARSLPKTGTGLGVVTPYLCVNGAAAAIAFYAAVFGAVEEGERYVDESDGRIGHAQFRIGDSALYISDEYPDYGAVGPTSLGGTTVALSVYVHDVEESYARALDAGAKGLRPPADETYGRAATILDPWGHRWSMQMIVEDRALPSIEGFKVIEKASIGTERTARAQQLLDGPAQLGYFALQAVDLGRAKSFFGALFGWTFEPTGHITNVDPPGGLSPAGIAGPPILYFQVADLDASTAMVLELGGTVITRSQYESGGNAECTDDQGTRFDLHLPAPGYERQ